MPVQIPAAAGKPYMPSNGTEGNMFEEQWCGPCVKRSSCRKMLNAMAGIQPRAWRYDDEGRPVCTSFADTRQRRVARCKTTDDLFG